MALPKCQGRDARVFVDSERSGLLNKKCPIRNVLALYENKCFVGLFDFRRSRNVEKLGALLRFWLAVDFGP